MKQLEIESSNHFYKITVTKDSEGFHFQDGSDGAEVWIPNESIESLVKFLIDNQGVE